jgi:DNA-directed RNA polymerase specialized sigma24 family protein
VAASRPDRRAARARAPGRAALDELPEAERRALYLRYYEGLSPPDIARAVGAPLGTIKSRLALGREHLRRRLDRDYGERGSWLGLLMPLGATASSRRPHIRPSLRRQRRDRC